MITYSLEQLYVTGEGKYVGLAAHTFLAMLSMVPTVPMGAHAIARAAHRGGVLPTPAVVNKLKEVEELIHIQAFIGLVTSAYLAIEFRDLANSVISLAVFSFPSP